MKFISVVIATYNRSDMLLKCINSVLLQKYPRNKFEILVVNDCSTDDTMVLIKRVKRNHINVRVLSHKENKGEAGSRNTGIKAARGEIIAFIDDDCVARLGWLSAIRAAFRRGVDGVEGMTTAPGSKGPFDSYVENTKGGRYMTCNMSYRASLIKKVRCDERLRHANRVDSDMAFSVMERGGQIVFQKKAVVEHSVTRNSFMSKLRKKKFFANDALLFKKHPVLYKKDIVFPFEKFTPLYIPFVILSVFNPVFAAALVATAVCEILHRKWHPSALDFIKFVVLQSVGSFVIVGAVFYGCLKYRCSPRIFLP